MVIFWIITFILWLVPFILLNTNLILSCKLKRTNKVEINYVDVTGVFLTSLVPIVNLVVMAVFGLMSKEDTYLLSYNMLANEAYKCYSCGSVTRAGHSVDFEIECDYWSNYAIKNEMNMKCPVCDSNRSFVKTSKYDKMYLPNGLKLNLIKTTIMAINGGKYKVVNELRKNEEKRAKLEFIDSQLAIKQKVTEEKLKKLNKEMEEKEKLNA